MNTLTPALLIFVWLMILLILTGRALIRPARFFSRGVRNFVLLLIWIITTYICYAFIYNPVFFTVSVILFIVTALMLSTMGAFKATKDLDRWGRRKPYLSGFLLVGTISYIILHCYIVFRNLELFIAAEHFLSSYGVAGWGENFITDFAPLFSPEQGWLQMIIICIVPFLLRISGVLAGLKSFFHANRWLGRKMVMAFCIITLFGVIFSASFFFPMFWPVMEITHIAAVSTGFLYSRLTRKVRIVHRHIAILPGRTHIPTGTSVYNAAMSSLGWENSGRAYTGYFRIGRRRKSKIPGRVERNGGYWDVFIQNPPKKIFDTEHKYCFRARQNGWYWVHWKDYSDDPGVLVNKLQEYLNNVTGVRRCSANN